MTSFQQWLIVAFAGAIGGTLGVLLCVGIAYVLGLAFPFSFAYWVLIVPTFGAMPFVGGFAAIYASKIAGRWIDRYR